MIIITNYYNYFIHKKKQNNNDSVSNKIMSIVSTITVIINNYDHNDNN